MTTFYDKTGKQLEDHIAWAKLFEDDAYQRIAFDEVAIPGSVSIEVSTVWMGFDPSGAEPPLIFEVLLRGGVGDQKTRYATEEQARAAHAEFVRLAREQGTSE